MLTTLFRRKSNTASDVLCPVSDQIAAWRKANRKMRWRIPEKEFEMISAPPRLTNTDIRDGFAGVILSYGFGDDGQGNADAVLSGKLVWDFAVKRRRPKTWQCEYIDFDHSEHFRLCPTVPIRPKGFYFSKFRHGERFQKSTVTGFRKRLAPEDTGCGPEGFQLLTITHPHFDSLMNSRQMIFMTFADYDVAPTATAIFLMHPKCSAATTHSGWASVMWTAFIPCSAFRP